MFTRKICKMTSQSVLKGCQIFRLRNFLWQIIPLIDYAYKKGMFKTIQSCRCKLITIIIILVQRFVWFPLVVTGVVFILCLVASRWHIQLRMKLKRSGVPFMQRVISVFGQKSLHWSNLCLCPFMVKELTLNDPQLVKVQMIPYQVRLRVNYLSYVFPR